MPTVNVYFKKLPDSKFDTIVSDLKVFLAEKLTCGDIKLSPEEVSVRFIKIDGGDMIGDAEVEISAASFSERVSKQDEICLDVAKYIDEIAPHLGDVKVWLKLSELGHSWE